MSKNHSREHEQSKEELIKLQHERIWAGGEPFGHVYKEGEPVPDSACKPVPAAQHPWDNDLSSQLGERQN